LALSARALPHWRVTLSCLYVELGMKKLALAAAFSAFLPLAANAELVRYNFTGFGGLGSSGFIDIDVTGPGNVASSVLSWSFTWNGTIIDNSNSVQWYDNAFFVDANFDFVSSNGFIVSPDPVFAVFSATPPWFGFRKIGNDYIWRAITSTAESGIVSDGFTITRVANPVPEPGTLALLAACGLGYALSRRPKTAA
jgi:hypothetical protein